VQLNVLILLRKIHDAQALPYILPFFDSENPKVREAAVTTLCYLNQVKTCPPALALLSDPVETVRRAAALTLGHLADEEVIGLLSQALTGDSDWQVRRNAAKSLALHAAAEAIPALGTALQDEHWQVRKFTAQALQKVADDRVLPELVTALIG
jgi:HEAT repeat protein